MIEAMLQSDALLVASAVVGLAGTAVLIARDTASRALIERPTPVEHPPLFEALAPIAEEVVPDLRRAA